MLETESLVPLRRRFLSAFLLLLVSSAGLSEESSFWVQSESAEPGWAVLKPSPESLREQAQLIHTSLDTLYKHSDSRRVLRQLYRDIDHFEMLGKKRVLWGGRQSTLVSFKGKVGQQDLAARALLGPSDRGTEIVVLIYHPKAKHNFRAELDAVMSLEPSSLPGSIRASAAPEK